MALIKLLAGPLRRVAGFPLVQLIAAIAAVLWLQAADGRSIPGEIFGALDRLVDATVRLLAATFELRSFTRSWLTTGFMIGYVYLAGLCIVLVVRLAIRGAVEYAARRNTFGLTDAIARERGIAAYQAWEPLERIRPAQIAQDKWEERFAWPADGAPPYPPWWQRTARAAVLYTAMVLVIAALLQAFTPFAALAWLRKLAMWLAGA